MAILSWKFGTSEGSMFVSTRKKAREMVVRLNDVHGEGSHWVNMEERDLQDTVDELSLRLKKAEEKISKLLETIQISRPAPELKRVYDDEGVPHYSDREVPLADGLTRGEGHGGIEEVGV